MNNNMTSAYLASLKMKRSREFNDQNQSAAALYQDDQRVVHPQAYDSPMSKYPQSPTQALPYNHQANMANSHQNNLFEKKRSVPMYSTQNTTGRHQTD